MIEKKMAAALAAVTAAMMEDEAAAYRAPAEAHAPSPWPVSGRDAIMGMRQLVTMRMIKRI
jgi:hypothetical protein